MPPDGGPRTPAVMHCIIAVQGEAQLTEPVAEMSGLDRRSTAWPVTGGTAEAPPGFTRRGLVRPARSGSGGIRTHGEVAHTHTLLSGGDRCPGSFSRPTRYTPWAHPRNWRISAAR